MPWLLLALALYAEIELEVRNDANRHLETVRKLLWVILHPVRTVYALPERPLVLRQVGHDWIEAPTL